MDVEFGIVGIQGVGSSGIAADLVNDFELVQFGSSFVFTLF
jgi:hypothetical protein